MSRGREQERGRERRGGEEGRGGIYTWRFHREAEVWRGKVAGRSDSELTY